MNDLAIWLCSFVDGCIVGFFVGRMFPPKLKRAPELDSTNDPPPFV